MALREPLMEPKPEPLDRAAELFDQALTEQPADRAGFIRRACPNDYRLQDMLQDMLAAHQRQGDFLAQPTSPRENSSVLPDDYRSTATAIDPAGIQIDCYKL